MPLNTYLLGLKISTFFVFLAWTSVVLYINPNDQGVLGKSLFYGTLFLWFSGGVSLLLTWLQKKLLSEERAAHCLGENMRQGLIVSFFLLLILFLQYHRFLVLWSWLLVSTAFLLIELYFAHRILPEKESEESYQSAKFKMQPQHSRLKR